MGAMNESYSFVMVISSSFHPGPTVSCTKRASISPNRIRPSSRVMSMVVRIRSASIWTSRPIHEYETRVDSASSLARSLIRGAERWMYSL